MAHHLEGTFKGVVSASNEVQVTFKLGESMGAGVNANLRPPHPQTLLDAIAAGRLAAHPTKAIIKGTQITSYICSVQKSTKLKVPLPHGLEGNWNPLCQARLLAWLKEPVGHRVAPARADLLALPDVAAQAAPMDVADPLALPDVAQQAAPMDVDPPPEADDVHEGVDVAPVQETSASDSDDDSEDDSDDDSDFSSVKQTENEPEMVDVDELQSLRERVAQLEEEVTEVEEVLAGRDAAWQKEEAENSHLRSENAALKTEVQQLKDELSAYKAAAQKP